MCNENKGFVRLIHYQQILNTSSYTITWLVKIQINPHYFTKVLYDVVVVFNIIKWVLWSSSQRILSKSCQTNPLLPEREVQYILRCKQRETPTKKTDGGYHLEREKRMFCWKTFILFFFYLTSLIDRSRYEGGLSQNLRLTCYLLWVFEELLRNHTGSSTCYDCYY